MQDKLMTLKKHDSTQNGHRLACKTVVWWPAITPSQQKAQCGWWRWTYFWWWAWRPWWWYIGHTFGWGIDFPGGSNSKLDKTTRKGKAKAQGTPDSRWIWCAKIDPVVFANVSSAVRTADRAASRLQQFWLDAVNPLVFILEKAEEMNLPKEVIGESRRRYN